jgi:serine/threonine-protein kinase
MAEIGQRIGDYQIVGILGAGGMGKVYKVRNTISERVEAMKVLLPNLQSDPELADRFMREIKVQASLEHPNIAALRTAMRVDNQLVMIMEYVEGQAIEAMLQNGPLPVDCALDYMSQVLSALGYAHARGVVHRDIKPANMMVTTQGQMKLMDFGIAKLTQDRKLTQTGHTVGSLYYMSPEQIQGAALDARSDLYSLGVSFYEMVTGRRPFQGDSDYSIMAAHLQQQPVPPLQLDPRLPGVLNEIILMSIAKEPAQRFQSAEAFKAAIDNVRRTLGGAPAQAPAAPRPQAAPAPLPPPPPPPASASSGKRGLYIALGSLVTLAVIVLAAMQLPKFFKTQADSAPASANAVQAPVNAPAAAVQEPAPAPMAAPPAGGQQAAPAQAASTPAPAGGGARSRAQAAPVRAAGGQQAPVQAQPVYSQPQAQPAQAPPQQAQHPAAAAVPDAAFEKAVEEATERLVQMGSRANAARSSVGRLEKAQKAQGLGLRGDIAAARQRMEYQLDAAEAALKAGDPAKAKRALDAAEKDLDKLDNFLGR